LMALSSHGGKFHTATHNILVRRTMRKRAGRSFKANAVPCLAAICRPCPTASFWQHCSPAVRHDRLNITHRVPFHAMTTSFDDLAAATAARDFARALGERWQSQLAGEIIGLYLIGSLAHGGFSRRYSDIDLALITESGLEQATFNGLCAQA